MPFLLRSSHLHNQLKNGQVINQYYMNQNTTPPALHPYLNTLIQPTNYIQPNQLYFWSYPSSALYIGEDPVLYEISDNLISLYLNLLNYL